MVPNLKVFKESGDHEFGGQFILQNSLKGKTARTLSHSTILNSTNADQTQVLTTDNFLTPRVA